MIPQNIVKSLTFSPLASAPSNPSVGEFYLDAASQKYLVWNGSNWVYFPDNSILSSSSSAANQGPTASPTLIDMGIVDIDSLGNVTSLTPWTYTCTVPGVYKFSANISVVSATNQDVYFYFKLNGAYTRIASGAFINAGGEIMCNPNGFIKLAAGDQVTLEFDPSASATIAGAALYLQVDSQFVGTG